MALMYDHNADKAPSTHKDFSTDEKEDNGSAMGKRGSSIQSDNGTSNWLSKFDESRPDNIKSYTKDETWSRFDKVLRHSWAYSWLVSRLSQRYLLSFSSPNLLDGIENEVFLRLYTSGAPRRMSRRKPLPVAELTFPIIWDPGLYLLGQSSLSELWNRVICVTGTRSEAQATTVSNYMCQTWTKTGKCILELLEGLMHHSEQDRCLSKICQFNQRMQPGKADVAHLDGGNCWHLRARISPSGSCSIIVIGGFRFVSEVAGQVAWLEATLRPKQWSDGVVVCQPRLKSLVIDQQHTEAALLKATCQFSVDYEKDHKATMHDMEDGFCWSVLFSNTTLVSGYPILRRPSKCPGLEVSLSTMAFLTQSKHIFQIGDRMIQKGLSSLLIASKATRDIVIWHALVSHKSGERISYFDERLDTLQYSLDDLTSLRMLEGARHIVGWCTSATDMCGKKHLLTSNCIISDAS